MSITARAIRSHLYLCQYALGKLGSVKFIIKTRRQFIIAILFVERWPLRQATDGPLFPARQLRRPLVPYLLCVKLSLPLPIDYRVCFYVSKFVYAYRRTPVRLCDNEHGYMVRAETLGILSWVRRYESTSVVGACTTLLEFCEVT